MKTVLRDLAFVAVGCLVLLLGACRTHECVGRPDHLLRVYQDAPAWTQAFTADFLNEMAKLASDALASVSDADWKAYLRWVRQDPSPGASIAGVALVSAYIAGNPAAHESAKLAPGEKLLCKEIIPALPVWRGLLTTGLPVAVQAGTGDSWSDDQLAAFMAATLYRSGVTPEKIRHDQWIMVDPVGRRLLALLMTALEEPPPPPE